MRLNWKNIRERIKAICFGIFIGLLLCEIFLRIYNPFPFTIKKGRLILPANQTKVFKNKWISKLDKEIHYSRNSLGFRGPELPDSAKNLLSIITIGGSTTECKFLSDSCTWPFRLYKKLKDENQNIWLNNAGIDGHSTFGHLLLLKEYILKLKPKYVLLLTGINDVELDKPDEFDLMTENKISTRSFKLFIKSLANQTELGRTIFSFYHVQMAYKKGLIHKEIDLTKLVDNPLPDSIVQQRLKQQAPYLIAYKERLDSIINQCLRAGITPLLITQPSLFGDYTDSVTKVSVGNKWLATNKSDNFLLNEKVLELYNNVLRSYSPRLAVIDLSLKMPKNSFYFYDFIHFTNAGAEKVAEILNADLQNYFSNKKLK